MDGDPVRAWHPEPCARISFSAWWPLTEHERQGPPFSNQGEQTMCVKKQDERRRAVAAAARRILKRISPQIQLSAGMAAAMPPKRAKF